MAAKSAGGANGGGWRKFRLLIWKNYILQKRHKIQTAFEVIIPVFFTLILVLVRALIKSDKIDSPTYYPAFNPVDPVGTALLRGTYILYAPNTANYNAVMNKTRELFLFKDKGKDYNLTLEDYQFIGYPDEKTLEDDYFNNPLYTVIDREDNEDFRNENPVLAAVVFLTDPNSEEIKYRLRFPASHHGSSLQSGQKPRWFTELLYSEYQVPGPRQPIEDQKDSESDYEYELEKMFREHGGSPGYWRQGFVYLQFAVDYGITQYKIEDHGFLGNIPFGVDFSLNRFPYPKYIDDVFVIALQSQFPLFLVLSFIYPVINISKSIVHEKERRLKESMKMMGLPNWLHWSAWFAKSFVFLLLSIIIMTIIYKIPMFGDGLCVLTYADGSLLFVFLLTYLFSLITLGFLVSSFFSTANSASTASGVIFFVTYFPYIFLQPRYNELTKGSILATSIFSNTGMAFGCQIITMFEGTGAGIQWSTIAQGASPDDEVSMLDIMIMLVVDGLLYLFLAIYIEGVFPGDYGVPMPWYFPFTKWYWCGDSRSGGSETITVQPASVQGGRRGEYFEKEPKSKAGIKIMELRKEFGKKVVVDDLTLNLFENQVTALLGHNGAGKTTTMSMITGLFPPTSGTVLVNGYDIRTDIQSVRNSLGLCPQHDVLFDEMTVEEHLRFFCLLKGHDSQTVQSEIDRMLVSLKLENKRHAQSQTLSGGMKRKLSVGVALVGGSKVVLLDEPTSGMDPGARRSTWDLISNEKKGRTIVLSTHFMDEADLLGDRIAIMAHGRVICCGSSLFLKKKYGGGYHLIIVKEPQCQVNRITELLQRRMPEVDVDQNIGAELSYSLPDGKAYMFPEMFQELEARKRELGIASYGCSITQMEEVFMRVGEQVEEEMNGMGHLTTPKNQTDNPVLNGNKRPNYQAISMDNMPPSTSGSTTTFKINHSDDESDRNVGMNLLTQQLLGMLVKKCLYAVRNKLLLVVQTIVPVFFLLISLIIMKTMPDVGTPTERDLDLKKYTQMGTPITAIECWNSATQEFCDDYQNVAGIDSDIELIPRGTSFEDYIIGKSEDNLPRVNYQNIVGLKATANENGTLLNGYFNNQPYHTPPVALNFLTNTILRETVQNDKLKITVSNFPLPFTNRDKIDNLSGFSGDGFQVGFNISFGMSFLAASFVVFLIKERETKSKHLQFVSGVKFPIFWLAHFLFDCVNYIIPCFALMIVLAAFQTEDFKGAKMQGIFLLVLLMYGWAVIPLMYLFSFLFTVPSSGYTRSLFFNFLTGVATLLAVTIMKIPDLNLVHVAEGLEWPFMFFPNYDVGYSISQLSYNKQLHKYCGLLTESQREVMCSADPDFDCCKNYPVDYLAWRTPGIGRNLFFSFLIGCICHIILFVIESKIIQKIRYRNEAKKYTSGTFERDATALEDSDVAAENHRVRNTNLEELYKTNNMVLRDLTKYYKKFLAVDRLCLGVQQGECFGLLGVNGAGKTTTFKMLTGDIPISLGDAYITEKSVKSHIKEVQRVIGYCPQFDALIPELTGRETIRLFARLRGVKEPEIDGLVDKLASDLLFSEHVEKACGSYSGGNKRKLSTALALIGNPPLVFLDEPTTGMDPVARRHLWNTIIKVRESGTSVILTSHSMEECEALCTRLAIMVNGKFRCLGGTQHLKNKFGDGYTIIAQMEAAVTVDEPRRLTRTSLELGRRRSSTLNRKPEQWEQDLQPLRNFIERNFPGCQLKDIHPAYVHYHIPEDGGVTWGEMFRKMEEAKAMFKLEAYSVGQTSLEQVFLGFAKGQCNDDD